MPCGCPTAVHRCCPSPRPRHRSGRTPPVPPPCATRRDRRAVTAFLSAAVVVSTAFSPRPDSSRRGFLCVEPYQPVESCGTASPPDLRAGRDSGIYQWTEDDRRQHEPNFATTPPAAAIRLSSSSLRAAGGLAPLFAPVPEGAGESSIVFLMKRENHRRNIPVLTQEGTPA